MGLMDTTQARVSGAGEAVRPTVESILSVDVEDWFHILDVPSTLHCRSGLHSRRASSRPSCACSTCSIGPRCVRHVSSSAGSQNASRRFPKRRHGAATKSRRMVMPIASSMNSRAPTFWPT